LGYHGVFSSANGKAISKSKHSHLPPGRIEHLPPGWADVLPLSHEISEWINDPFINNFVSAMAIPWHTGSCQGNLETGDPLEVLPHPDFPVTIGGFTYHPQTRQFSRGFRARCLPRNRRRL